MYILIKDSVEDKYAPLLAAHAALACYKKYEEDNDMQTWISTRFKKVICRVNDGKFKRALKEEKNIVLSETKLNLIESCAAFCPREEFAKPFRFFKMWEPTE